MAGVLEALLMNFMGSLKTEMRDYCEIETVDGNECLVTSDGKYGSIIQFNGVRSIISRQQFHEMAQRISDAFEPYLKNRGHYLQVYFMRDDDSITELESFSQTQRATSDALRMDMSDLIDETVSTLRKYTYQESCYLVLWSSTALLNSAEINKQRQDRLKDKKDNNIPALSGSQNPFVISDYLKAKHNSYVTSIFNALNASGSSCDVKIMTIKESLLAIRKSIYPGLTNERWEASYPGERHFIQWKENGDHDDVSEAMYRPLNEQIMNRSAEIGTRNHPTLSGTNRVQIGNRIYSPVIIEVPPKKPEIFQSLFNALNSTSTYQRGVERACPYAISFMIEGDGIGSLTWKGFIGTVLQMGDSRNKALRLAIEHLNAVKEEGIPIVKLSITAMTWIDEDDNVAEELPIREKGLNDALQQWGHPQVGERTGDPMEVVQSTALALCTKGTGVPAAAPLLDAVSLLPLTRPTSPFPIPSTYFRSLDGKLLSYQRFSSEQSTWVTLVCGKPGSGKSVLCNHLNVETCLIPGQRTLPYICIIDIGASSSGAIDLIKESISNDQKHLVVHKRLQNNRRDGINPMDTFLGLRKQISTQFDNTVSFIVAMVTPPERRGEPLEGMTDFVRNVLIRAYDMKSDVSADPRPNEYNPGINHTVDRSVKELKLEKLREGSSTPLTYWDITDACFKAGMLHEAEVAQRYAMPRLDDLVEVATTFREQYANIKTNNGSSIVDAFINAVRTAVTEFPLFSGETNFDIGSARIVSLDLQDVAQRSEALDVIKRSALMFMIARESFMKKISFHKELLSDIRKHNPLYLEHYRKLADNLVDVKKLLFIDEWHVVKHSKALKEQIDNDARVGRKLSLEITLSSQKMSDFDGITSLGTTYFILDKGDKETQDWMRSHISLTTEEIQALNHFANGPSRVGSTFLARFKTARSDHSQMFTVTLGPKRLWALSTTPEDMRLRGMLYDKLSKPAARALLAERFPGGSCKKYIEERATRLHFNDGFMPSESEKEDKERSEVEKLAAELIQHYENNPSKYDLNV